LEHPSLRIRLTGERRLFLCVLPRLAKLSGRNVVVAERCLIRSRAREGLQFTVRASAEMIERRERSALSAVGRWAGQIGFAQENASMRTGRGGRKLVSAMNAVSHAISVIACAVDVRKGKDTSGTLGERPWQCALDVVRRSGREIKNIGSIARGSVRSVTQMAGVMFWRCRLQTECYMG
jgi:hypothetical protein